MLEFRTDRSSWNTWGLQGTGRPPHPQDPVQPTAARMCPLLSALNNPSFSSQGRVRSNRISSMCLASMQNPMELALGSTQARWLCPFSLEIHVTLTIPFHLFPFSPTKLPNKPPFRKDRRSLGIPNAIRFQSKGNLVPIKSKLVPNEVPSTD